MTESRLIYRRAVRKGKKKLNEIIPVEEIKKSLAERGLNRNDINVAFNLMACIVYFDSIIFPDDNIEDFIFCYDEVLSVAGYRPSSKKHPREAYMVKVKKIYKHLQFKDRLIVYKEDGHPINYDDLPFVSYHQRILSVAAHEVRHRLQKRGIRMFSPENIYDDPQISSYVNYSRIFFEKDRDYGEIKCRKRKSLEFDARVIEELILCGLNNQYEEFEICGIISMEG